MIMTTMMSTTNVPAQTAGAVIDNMLTRHSVRRFTSQPVEAEKIELMLRAGMQAPTAVNK